MLVLLCDGECFYDDVVLFYVNEFVVLNGDDGCFCDVGVFVYC